MSKPADITPFSITIGAHDDIEIVWLHGWGQSHECFMPLAELFENKATNRLFDLFGFGKTPTLSKGAGTEDYAKALMPHLFKNKNANKRIIIGHSFGCRVALQLAQLNPDVADILVLIAAAGLKRQRTMRWKTYASLLKFMGRSAVLMDRVFKTQLKQKFSERFGSRDYKNAGALKETFVAVVNEDLSDIATKTNIPTLLIYGEDDTETPPEFGTRYQTLIPRAILKIIKGFDHLSILSRGAHQCQTHITKFIETMEKPS